MSGVPTDKFHMALNEVLGKERQRLNLLVLVR